MSYYYTNADHAFGTEQELIHHRAIVNKFGECKKIKGRFAIFDFEGDNFFVELKCNRVSITKFPTAIIGKNKIDKAEFVYNTGTDVYFCFNYLEGLYFWKYNKEDALEKLKFSKCGRTDRGKCELRDYCFIPVELLTKI